MTEILFYHLTGNSVEQALPGLLERSLERGWRVTVQTENDAQRNALNQHLWTYRDESFLPHGSSGDNALDPAQQPVWLTTTADNSNASNVRFVVGNAEPGESRDYVRLVFMFDGNDEDAVARARERWRQEKSAGHELAYWQQDEQGRWRKPS